MAKQLGNTKIKSTALVLIAIFLLSSPLLTVQALTGYTAMPDRDTETNIGVTPTLIGLGQQVVMDVLVWPAPSGPTYYGQDLVSKHTAGYANITVTVTHPDGQKETFMPTDVTLQQIGINEPGRTQIVGTLLFDYKPSTVGNYSVTANFP